MQEAVVQQTIIKEKPTVENVTYRNDVLKILAMLTMLIDHFGALYFPREMMYRTIGRLAFPIFAYQIAIGYSKTSNKKKYVTRLFIFALISQIPYSFMNPNLNFRPLRLNVLFMFLVALGVLYLYDMSVKYIKDFWYKKNYKALLLGILMFAATLALVISPEIVILYVNGFNLEYNSLGLALVLLFYVFRNNKSAAIYSIIALYFIQGCYSSVRYAFGRSSFRFVEYLFDFKYIWDRITRNNDLFLLKGTFFNARGLLALIPVYRLSKVELSSIRLNKYVGYIFYPAHLAVLLLGLLIFRQ
ncbi:MAG: TraX family protein [Bacillota bacterium]